ncbi:MAG: ATP-binding protein, partial [Chloroflexia bacterium]|nr:ATP-binding protein [Chloroflexia bacterium]
AFTVVNTVDDTTVLADPVRIGQVLRNLLGNAVKYTPPGTPVELRARPADAPGWVRVEVADQGDGIHPDDLDRIFDKFGRGRRSSSGWIAGTGLGLYLSRRIVYLHGSDLTVTTTTGAGATFGFDLEITTN